MQVPPACDDPLVITNTSQSESPLGSPFGSRSLGSPPDLLGRGGAGGLDASFPSMLEAVAEPEEDGQGTLVSYTPQTLLTCC